MAAKTKKSAPQLRSISIAQLITIDAPPARVWAALTKKVSSWWGAPYLISEDPEDIRLEAKLGGHLYESWGKGGGSSWGTVTSIMPGSLLEITGPCGMTGCFHGAFSIQLSAQGKKTVLEFEHHAFGELTAETEESYAYGWNDLLAVRLKTFVEEGKRLGLGHEPG